LVWQSAADHYRKSSICEVSFRKLKFFTGVKEPKWGGAMKLEKLLSQKTKEPKRVLEKLGS